MRKPTRRTFGEGRIAREAGDMRTVRLRRGRDDGMDRRNLREPREAASGSAGQRKLAAREGQARPRAVAERLVVASKPGNSGGAKGPQFKDQRQEECGNR
jgi:hypothetical protein